VGGTGSESYPRRAFGSDRVKSYGSGTRELVESLHMASSDWMVMD
jgi:hypothetical protein